MVILDDDIEEENNIDTAKPVLEKDDVSHIFPNDVLKVVLDFTWR